MKGSETFEFEISAEDTPIETALEKRLKASTNRRVVVKIRGGGDRISVIERLRDLLSANISRTVVIYVE
ncbi:MAG: hypothetical protein QW407_01795 [Thermofilaceae archaeon]|uniref:hypothetical protein n=1 Tax=Thermofilum sp. TaxID=1961369 RepID=UPI003165C2EB